MCVHLTVRPHGLQPTRLLCPWGFSRLEYWSGLPCPPPGDLPNPGIEPRSPSLQVDSLLSETAGKFIDTALIYLHLTNEDNSVSQVDCCEESRRLATDYQVPGINTQALNE